MQRKIIEPVLIVAGGTGGHISPGVGLAQAIQERCGSGVIYFLTLKKNRHYPDLERANYPVLHYSAPPLTRRFPGFFLFPLRFLRAILVALRLLRRHRIGHVVGMGGYPMVPALIAARILSVPYYLCEQNGVPGRSTDLFAKRARRIFLAIEIEREPDSFRAIFDRLILTGNPGRRELMRRAEAARAGARRKKGALRILVVGGSQGAVQINTMLISIFEKIAASDSLKSNPIWRDCEWKIQCGVSNLRRMKSALPEPFADRVELIGFHPDIHEFYLWADLMVCRAGAGVLNEASLFGLPMLLIPYPYATDNHQLANANYFERLGAAKVFYQKDTDPTRIEEQLRSFLADRSQMESMAAASLAAARPDAAERIIDAIVAGSESADV